MQPRDNTDVLGIDISHYTSVSDWSKVKNAGVKFLYTKGTQGLTNTDSKVDEFVKGAKSVGIPVGIYHFAEPDKDPVAQAKHFLDVLNKYTLELLPVLDLETNPTPSSTNLVKWVRSFANTLGRKFILYTGNWFIESYPEVNQLADIPLWTSYYKDTQPPDESGWSVWTIWQYSETGKIDGIQGDVDLDYGVSLDLILVNPPKGDANMNEKIPYDSNQFKYLVDLAKGADNGNAEWARGQLAKMMGFVTGGASVVNGEKNTEAVIIYNKVFIPVTDIFDLLGLTYSWNDSAKTVTINPLKSSVVEVDIKDEIKVKGDEVK